ncbi:MAG: HAMP domain-containing histidine kinase [Anaerolineae bacterium]|nr:HAMP domain-containing histidine kinase [Anaerolineae bacterium]
MLVLPLRWFLLGLFLAIVAAVLLALWLDRRRARRRAAETFADTALHAVLERAPFGWMVLESPERYVYANEYARRLLELESSSGPVPAVEWGFLLDDDRADVRRGRAPKGRYRVLRLPSGRAVRWWLMSGERWDYLFLLDVTSQYEAEEARTQLFAGLSHELRTPVGAILTHLEILRLPDIPEEAKRQSLHLLQTETRRLARMVHLMLELGRLETSPEIDRRPVDLADLAERAISSLASQAQERGIHFSLEADTPLPTVWGDPDRLMQVFLNLLDNVLKHCRPGDRATVILRRAEGGVLCAVRDTGPGIPAEHLPHVTRRFYRAAKQEVEGSGLGLALVEEILRRHGSRLEISSRMEGETGTCVQFVLPTMPFRL